MSDDSNSSDSVSIDRVRRISIPKAVSPGEVEAVASGTDGRVRAVKQYYRFEWDMEDMRKLIDVLPPLSTDDD